MTRKTILVTGGSGFIGSQVNQLLLQAGFDTVILDNSIHGSFRSLYYDKFHCGDINNPENLQDIFQKYPIDAVMHFAALIDVGESIKAANTYYKNNVVGLLNLLDVMLQFRIHYFVFSSSAAVYGQPTFIPISEKHPLNPMNPYGKTKFIAEMILEDYSASFGLRYSSLRYFNAAGGDPEGKIKNDKPRESNLIPKVLRSFIENSLITVYGTDYPTFDGTCIRDYIHVYDLATAHLLALDALMKGASSSVYNLGNGSGYSVKEVISIAEEVTGKKGNVIHGPRRAGDPAILLADATKAKQELGWSPRFPEIKTIIADAWKSYSDVQKIACGRS